MYTDRLEFWRRKKRRNGWRRRREGSGKLNRQFFAERLSEKKKKKSVFWLSEEEEESSRVLRNRAFKEHGTLLSQSLEFPKSVKMFRANFLVRLTNISPVSVRACLVMEN